MIKISTQPVMSLKAIVCRALLTASMLTYGTAQAAELASITWDEGTQPALTIQLTGKTTYQTASLEGGQRLRISFPQTTLGGTVSDIEGRGTVKGVYPYLADNGSATHVDLLMTEPGSLKVEEIDNGYRIIALASGAEAPAAVPVPVPDVTTAPAQIIPLYNQT